MTTFEKLASIASHSIIPNRPYHVQWLLTRKCNFRCRSCSVWREQDSTELSTEEVKRGLDVLRRLGVIDIVLSGGNPLLRDDIGEIIEYASRFFMTTVYDNGSMAVKKTEALCHADFVAISIDSLDSSKNDYIRGARGALRNALNALEKLRENGISVGVAPTISQYNLYEIVDLTKYFLNGKIPVWYSLYSYDSSKDQNSLFRIGKKEDEFIITDKETMVKVCDSLLALKKKDKNLYLTSKLLKAIRNLYLTGERSWNCHALQSFFMVDHLGRVAGCHVHSPVASIFDLPSQWNSTRFKRLRTSYRHCARCCYLCYMFYSLHGSVLGNFQIFRDQWKNAKILARRNSLRPLGLARTQ
jgi:MoaA/NifB/PqqE/SkfB family radical SAM enzyme